MTETDREERPSARGRGFPVLSLPSAVEVVRKLGHYGMQHKRSAVWEHLGHQSDSGPFRKKLAALRDFGLVDSGSATITLTELGRRLAVPDGSDDKPWLAQAFANVPVFLDLYQAAGRGVPLSRQALGASAFHNHGIAPGSRENFVDSFIASAIAAGLAEPHSDGVILLDASSPFDEVEVDATAAPLATRATAPVASTAGTNFAIRKPLGDGEVEFRLATARPLSADDFRSLTAVIDAVDKLAAALALDETAD